MKLSIILLLTVTLGVIGSSRGRERSSRRDREIFREILCVLKEREPEECRHDRGIDAILQRMEDDNDIDLDLGRLDRPTPKFLSASSAAAAAAAAQDDTVLPPGVASKRDAFYSDWRRRRR